MKWTSRFKVVSYYTPDYEDYANDLARSLNLHMPDTPYELEAIDQVSWKKATCRKGQFMLDKLRASDRPILWIDADALVKDAFKMPDVDFAIFARFADRLRANWSPFRSGTVYLAKPHGMELAKLWAAYCKNQNDGIDQWALWDAWRDLMSRGMAMPSTYFLPRDYCRKVNESGPVKIQHLMASRSLKSKK